MYPEKAPTSYTRSPEPEIARRRFGFEFWLTVGLFLFLAGMTIAQRLFEFSARRSVHCGLWAARASGSNWPATASTHLLVLQAGAGNLRRRWPGTLSGGGERPWPVPARGGGGETGNQARIEFDDQVRLHVRRIRHFRQAGNAGHLRRALGVIDFDVIGNVAFGERGGLEHDRQLARGFLDRTRSPTLTW